MTDIAKESFKRDDERESQQLIEIKNAQEDEEAWISSLNANVDSLIIKLCHSDINFTTVQFE